MERTHGVRTQAADSRCKCTVKLDFLGKTYPQQQRNNPDKKQQLDHHPRHITPRSTDQIIIHIAHRHQAMTFQPAFLGEASHAFEELDCCHDACRCAEQDSELCTEPTPKIVALLEWCWLLNGEQTGDSKNGIELERDQQK